MLLLLGAAWCRAQDLPAQTIRVVVPLSAGSSLDARARVIADAIGQRIKRRVIVENRPGAGGTIGTQYVARSKPDGATLLFTNNSHVVGPHIYGNPGYDPIKDLAPVARAYVSGMVLVAHPGLRVGSIEELVALARASTAAPSYASSGTGGLPHLAMAMFARSANIELLHVPYRGDAQGLTDVLAGRVSVMISGYPAALSHVRAGSLRALAVTSSQRADIFPGVRTMAEAGYPGAVLDAWTGFFAPAGTPRTVIDRLNREIAAALALPKLQAHFAATGAQASAGSPDEFGALVKQEWERYGKLVRELGLRVE
ncbi:MAG TPA: tripartite tricarboxylate transporter substrate binding protein [Burkholderiales bacterium]|nr:tripartite tricarboxylate transporter substrate binding protein [Burkholderiales bacterium]